MGKVLGISFSKIRLQVHGFPDGTCFYVLLVQVVEHIHECLARYVFIYGDRREPLDGTAIRRLGH